MRTTLSFIATLGVASLANAQVVLDGALDEAYGKPIIVQNTQTGFGNANLGLIDFANGSELNAAHAMIVDGTLFLMLTGNLESNFNKLEVFIDAVPGGQNRLRSDNSGVDFNGLNRMGDDPKTPKVVEGLVFDEGFEADFWVGLTCGNSPLAVYMNYAELLTDGGGPGGYLGSGGAGLAGAQIFKSGLGFGLDNSNTAGVDGGAGLASGAGATTGVELRIPLTAIPGYTSGDLKVCVFVNGDSHNFVSNQILGPLGGGSNLGEPRNVNLADIPFEQFFVISNGGGGTPCPADITGDGGTGDGVVDSADLGAVLNQWSDDCPGCQADITGDDKVDSADLGALLSSWGPCN
jgi:hypothetical protein